MTSIRLARHAGAADSPIRPDTRRRRARR